MTVAPGSTERVPFPAGTATKATVTFEGLNTEPVTVTFDQPDCDPGNDFGGGEGDGEGEGAGGGTPEDNGGGLPVTGAAAGGIAAGAAALLIAGGVLFMVARRRRITFTP